FYESRCINGQVLLARASPFPRLTLYADGSKISLRMSSAGGKGFHVVYFGGKLVEEWRLIPPPPRVPICNWHAWQQSRDSFSEQLDGEVKYRWTTAMRA